MNPFALSLWVWIPYALITTLLMVGSVAFGFLHAKDKKYYDKGKLAWNKNDARAALAAIFVGPSIAWLWPVILVVVPSAMGLLRVKALTRSAEVGDMLPDYLSGIAQWEAMKKRNVSMALELEAATKDGWVTAPNGNKRFRASTGAIIDPIYHQGKNEWGYWKEWTNT